MKKQNEQVYEIDLLHLIKVLWQRAWIIILATFLAGAMAFCYARFLIEPSYSSTAMMYVNNSSISIGSTNVSISSGELSAAQSLVDTYLVILKSRTTLNEVIRQSGVDYTYEELSRMITSGAVNNTEIFEIKVTSTNADEAKLIANTIAKVLPKTISDVVDGSSVRVVDFAVSTGRRVAPSFTKYTAIGLVIGFVLSAGLIVVLDLADDVIREEDYLLQNYNTPILAMIPNLNSSGRKGYYYDKKYYKRNYAYRYQHNYGYGYDHAQSGKGEA